MYRLLYSALKVSFSFFFLLKKLKINSIFEIQFKIENRKTRNCQFSISIKLENKMILSVHGLDSNSIRGSKGTFDFCFKMKYSFDFFSFFVLIIKLKNEFQIPILTFNKHWKMNFCSFFYESFSVPKHSSDQVEF